MVNQKDRNVCLKRKAISINKENLQADAFLIVPYSLIQTTRLTIVQTSPSERT